MKTNLIIVEGLPGSGKSTTAAMIAEVLKEKKKEDLLNQMIIFANGVAAFEITDKNSFSKEAVSHSISQVCVGIVITDKLRDGTLDLSTAQAMAESCARGIIPQKNIRRYSKDIRRIRRRADNHIGLSVPAFVYMHMDTQGK